MTCTEVEALIHKELDGELLVGEVQALREHVETCPRCGALADGLQQLLVTTRRLAVSPTGTPDLVASVTRSLRRGRQLRLALIGSLAVAAGLLLFLLSTWQSASTPMPTPVPRPANVAQRPATGERGASPADFVSFSLNEGFTWVQEAWQWTREEVTSLAQSTGAAEEGPASESEGSWWEEVTATGGTLREISHEVSKRILPMEVPYLNETREEEEKV
jgi:hypothetical protein